ncbi:MAG: bifunctional hydroxymethylpyrimidine kinase/phosphomethylpyrimidine kinase, partial [Planctomycetes bacterium]|nr:bifunctional hydroxymethylpyrimidine kinase/phosphomethylpyrimidine kinase [Planctomycetota bacterium]
AVLVTGGDAGTEVCVRDFLFRDGCVTMLEAPRVPGPSPHGTGCALTASITALLARGRSLEAAIMTAREWVGRAIAAATILGAVNGARPRLVVGGDKE